MTCDTSAVQGVPGLSFALAEAELIWHDILRDAARGELMHTYGASQRWQVRLDPPVLDPPPQSHLDRFPLPIVGMYPARGCPFSCTFCSVVQIAGHAVRSEPVAVTLEGIRRAKAAGVKGILFTMDNFNKNPSTPALLDAMAENGLTVPFFAQVDSQIGKQEWLVEKMARAGCAIMMVGVESLNRVTLKQFHKYHNHPDLYAEISRLCKKYGILFFCSNIIGFPDDTRESIGAHVRELSLIGPAVSWFYILTPIPGTVQYDDFLERGLITASNLDRFDGVYPTWKHPNLSGGELISLMHECHAKMHRTGEVSGKVLAALRGNGSWFVAAGLAAYSLMVRVNAAHGVHPMIGGVMSRRVDHVDEYIQMRREMYGFTHVPLPKSIHPSSHELEVNRGMVSETILRMSRQLAPT